MSIGAAVKIFYKMKKEEIQTILYTIKEGDSIKIKVQDKSEEIRLRDVCLIYMMEFSIWRS
mgnify:CR=1 FL=1